ncbi:MAG: ATP-binding cassette domain-containing protein, partial [Notoacmeibacter sp.]
MSAIIVRDLHFVYDGGAALHFDFVVRHNARLAIMGASGSGKSTLLHLLAGFEKPLSGNVCIAGLDMAFMKPAARPLSILFQDNNLFDHLTIAQNTGLGLAPRLRLSESERSIVETALKEVGLEGLGHRLPAELSGGERQRAALARCLLRNKPVLLLDEPFAALGPAMRIEMLDLVMALQEQKNVTIIMVTHSPEDAAYFATEIGFMENRKLIGTIPAEMLKQPIKGSAFETYL